VIPVLPEMKVLSPLVSCVFFAWALVAPARGTAAARPNVVIFLADDSGWGDYSASGNTQLRTPNIDSIAQGGAVARAFLCLRGVFPRRALSF
jgi:arylsulfatase A-like enzyme